MIKRIVDRFSYVFTKDEMERISCEDKNGVLSMTVDVHGMAALEAKRFIKNIIALIRVAFRLIVIHGYHRGTAILQMLHTDFSDPKLISIDAVNGNEGRTLLSIAGC